MCANVSYTISEAIASITSPTGKPISDYVQLLEDGYDSVAVPSLVVGIHGIENLGGVVCPMLPTHADDAAAGTAGLAAGQFYKTAAGDLKVKL